MEQGLHASERRETSVRSLEVYPQSAAFPIRSAGENCTFIELVDTGHRLKDPRHIGRGGVERARGGRTGSHFGVSDQDAVGIEEPDVEWDRHIQHEVPDRGRSLVDEQHPVGPSRDLVRARETDLTLLRGVGDEDLKAGGADLDCRGVDIRLAGTTGDQDQETTEGQSDDLPLSNSAATSSDT
jgi:hypothetical protein